MPNHPAPAPVPAADRPLWKFREWTNEQRERFTACILDAMTPNHHHPFWDEFKACKECWDASEVRDSIEGNHEAMTFLIETAAVALTAVNAHASLVAENQRLREVLEASCEQLSDLHEVYCQEPEGLVHCQCGTAQAWREARAVLAEGVK